LITANLNRSENNSGNQNPKEKTNDARKKEKKKPGQQNTEPATK
jgi:hypothetical protein